MSRRLFDGELTLVRKGDRPAYIRDRGGFLFKFIEIPRFEGQDERYASERAQQELLVSFVFNALEAENALIAAAELTTEGDKP